MKKEDLDFGDVTTVNLDEYRGLPRENDQSYFYFMNHNLFDYVNINPERTHLPNGMNPDADEECKRYEEVIRSTGGVDLQLLGLDITDILDLMSQNRHLRRGHIVWTFRRVLLRQIKDFLLRRRMFQDRHIPWG